MAVANDTTVTWGNTTVGGVYDPWPPYWQWPTSTYIYTTTPTWENDYANEVEVERGEHDATLHFYRSSGPNRGRTLVKTLTIPLGVLDWLAGKES